MGTSDLGKPRRPWTRQRFIGGIRKYGLAAIADVGAVSLCYVAAVLFRTGARFEQLDIPDWTTVIFFAGITGCAQVLGNILFDVYWRDWGAGSLEDAIAVLKATGFGALALLAIEMLSIRAIPLGAIVAGASFAFVGEVALRLRPRWAQIGRAAFGRTSGGERLIVVGAGKVGRLLATDVGYAPGVRQIACFVDDDAGKIGSYIHGARVDGTVEDLPRLIGHYRPSTVVIAAAAPPGELIRRVIAACDGSDVRVRRVSGLSLITGDTSTLREIAIEELLARDPVQLDTAEARDFLRGKAVLVTGAAGSIGSELCAQLGRFGVARLALLDMNESALHDLNSLLPSSEIVLADIRDRPALDRIFDRIRPDIVFHAAAYKHVPILERDPLAAAATNVLGLANVLECAMQLDNAGFVFISSDKAVEPTSVLGFTKRFGELLTIAAGRELGRACVAVRFGNVLGSSGSVVPIFTRQIDAGGPVTVTDEAATRYFMTIPEAAGLVIEAGAISIPGDLMILDMGEPVSILGLAKRMIRLRGLRVPTDIRIQLIGLRPGEKVHERLHFSWERLTETQHPGVLRVADSGTLPSYEELRRIIHHLAGLVTQQAADAVLEELRAAISVPIDAYAAER